MPTIGGWVIVPIGTSSFTSTTLPRHLRALPRTTLSSEGGVSITIGLPCSSRCSAPPFRSHTVSPAAASVLHAPQLQPSQTGSSASAPVIPFSMRSHCSTVISEGLPGPLVAWAALKRWAASFPTKRMCQCSKR